jgi:hypothetical protein
MDAVGTLRRLIWEHRDMARVFIEGCMVMESLAVNTQYVKNEELQRAYTDKLVHRETTTE